MPRRVSTLNVRGHHGPYAHRHPATTIKYKADVHEGTINLGANKNPKAFAQHVTAGGDKGNMYHGIYKLVASSGTLVRNSILGPSPQPRGHHAPEQRQLRPASRRRS